LGVLRDLVIAALIILAAILLGFLVKAVLFLVLIGAVLWLLFRRPWRRSRA
jgi:hypothetical protein